MKLPETAVSLILGLGFPDTCSMEQTFQSLLAVPRRQGSNEWFVTKAQTPYQKEAVGIADVKDVRMSPFYTRCQDGCTCKSCN